MNGPENRSRRREDARDARDTSGGGSLMRPVVGENRGAMQDLQDLRLIESIAPHRAAEILGRDEDGESRADLPGHEIQLLRRAE